MELQLELQLLQAALQADVVEVAEPGQAVQVPVGPGPVGPGPVVDSIQESQPVVVGEPEELEVAVVPPRYPVYRQHAGV